MSETVPGGVYEGPKGHYHDAEGKAIPKDEALKLIKQVKELNSAPAYESVPPAVLAPAAEESADAEPSKKPSKKKG